MPPQTRHASKALATNTLSETDIQRQLNASYINSPLSDMPSPTPSHDTDSDISMSSPIPSPTSPSSAASSDDANSDYASSTHTPHLVSTIEHELHITRLQRNLLRNSLASAMREGDLPGSLNFKTRKHACKNALQPIFTTVLADLDFGVGARLSAKGVGELLVARARIVQRNEGHGRYMVATGRVGKGRDGRGFEAEEEELAVGEEGGRYVNGEEEGVERGVKDEGIEQGAGDEGVEQEEDVRQAPSNRDMDMNNDQVQSAHESRVSTLSITNETGPRPSVVAGMLGDFSLSGLAAQPEEDDMTPGSPMHGDASTPGSPMHFDEPTSQPEPEVQLKPTPSKTHTIHTPPPTDFWPVTFIIRVANSTSGTAILVSELLDPTQSPPITAESLSFARFLQLVPQKLGFDVEGRISAALPWYLRFLPEDSLVPLCSEETWWAVLQEWQGSRRRLCEFVVGGREEGEE